MENDKLKYTKVQEQVISWENGPLILIGAAGSGKTTALAARVVEKIKLNAGTHKKILVLTYTQVASNHIRKIVAEHVERLEEYALIGTFHSFCRSVLRSHGAHVGISPNYVEYTDDSDMLATLAALLEDSTRGWSDEIRNKDHQDILDFIKLSKRKMLSPSQLKIGYPSESSVQEMANVYLAYDEALSIDNAIDSDTVIFKTFELFRNNPFISKYYQSIYNTFIVDEFQNITDTFYTVLRRLTNDSDTDIVVAMDEAQQIYRWAMSMIKPRMRFEENYSASLLMFNDNFRVPANILEIAEQLVRADLNRSNITSSSKQKGNIRVRRYSSVEDEYNWIVKDIQEVVEKKPSSSIAVLTRYRDQMDPIILHLRKAGVPVKVYNSELLFQSEVMRWIYSFLNFTIRNDDKWFGKLVEFTQILFNSDISEKLTTDLTILYSSVTEKRWKPYVQTINKYLPSNLHIDFEIQEIINNVEKLSSWCANFLEWKNDGYNSDFIHESQYFTQKLLQNIASSLSDFLSILKDDYTDPGKEEGVVCQTVHSALGKEYDHVYIPHFREGVYPALLEDSSDSSNVMNDERKHCYVAFTRTRRELTITYSEKSEEGFNFRPSRFLKELSLKSAPQ
ncbi:ATP-dependent helicase [Paenibacillus sp. SZ31]|uniref:ATP-dependent helicase n=1 Tax=Paenibacillus sp. SZ31 TaxID=2725555 RepID=UPI00146A0482|nr:ATP-dependent helicase [Paenibacillus sp. SZ31]NMI06947.1 ATP-dependent helicase [Paenibacillus sp. SZ31]